MERGPTVTDGLRRLHALDASFDLPDDFEFEQVTPEVIERWRQSLLGLPTVSFELNLRPLAEEQMADQAAETVVDAWADIPEIDWQKLTEVLARLPQVTMRVRVDPPNRTTEYRLFMETWAPKDRDARQRFESQMRVLLQAEQAAAAPEQYKLIGALALSLTRAQDTLDERAKLLAGSAELLESTSGYFERILAAAARLGDHELQHLAAEIEEAYHFRAEPDAAPDDGG